MPPVQHDHVQVNVEVERAAEPMDQGHDTCPGAAVTFQSRLLNEMGLDGSNDNGQAAAEDIRTAREQHAQRPGKAENPLPDGSGRNDVVNEVRGGFDHAPSTARGTEATASFF